MEWVTHILIVVGAYSSTPVQFERFEDLQACRQAAALVVQAAKDARAHVPEMRCAPVSSKSRPKEQ